jgi:hypothetical protein
MSKSVRVRMRSVMEAAVAGKGVGLVQFMRALLRRSNRRFRKAGMAVVNSYGDRVFWSMIVDVRDVVTFGRGLSGRLGRRMREVEVLSPVKS